jgi:iron(III) transport system ATP-binding protein
MSVTLKEVTKVFDSPDDYQKKMVAVDNVSLEINHGEMVTLLGPSGCGKTTTLRMIAGFEQLSSGAIYLEGEDVTNQPPDKRNSIMVFQNYAIFPHLTVAGNVGFGPALGRQSKAEIAQKVDAILDLVGLSGMGKRMPNQLSGGQQQRVALARAIVNEPKLLLFDEPLSNLDAKLREQMRLEIRRIQQHLGITAVYVTHDQSEAMAISDRIVVMNKGKIEQVGTPPEIYNQPKTAFVADFIGQVNFVPAIVTEIGSGRVTVAVDQRLLQVTTSSPVAKGQEVKLVVRPETIRINEEDPFFRGKISKVLYLGATVEYEIQLTKGVMFATVISPIEKGILSVGTEVNVSFSLKGVHVLAS